MVKGLETFREHFRAFADRYVLIGGTACDLVMGNAGIEFRATKDLDIVLYVEALDPSFVNAFWEFVRAGGYQLRQTLEGRPQFYRFQKPTNAEYPAMLELFSRLPDSLTLPEDAQITPLPTDEDASSLSAILMDEDYYVFIQTGRKLQDGLPFIGAEHLIPLKALAWLNLTQRQVSGQTVDSRTIKKHRNDVFRLYPIIDPDVRPALPESVKKDMQTFLRRMSNEEIDLKSLGVGADTRDEILSALRGHYQLD